MLLSAEQIQEFWDRGFLVIDRKIAPDSMVKAQTAALRVVEKCANGDYPYCRADSRISDREIEKIEHIFHPDVFEPELLKAVVQSKILDYAKEVLNKQDVFCSFYRMHPTLRYSTWSSWHRDDPVDGRNWTIKATLPLFPESGFRVVPGSHKTGDKSMPANSADNDTDSTFKGNLANQITVPVNAGDILLFHTSIAHRGACAGREIYKRAQLHFRITATEFAHATPRVEDEWTNRPEVLALCDEGWREVITKDLQVGKTYRVTTRKPRSNLKGKLKQLRARAFYFGSRFLPDDHRWISDPPTGYVPWVRIEKAHKGMYRRSE